MSLSRVDIIYSVFLDSSMVEHAAVNRGVVGSSPTRGGKVNHLHKTCRRNVCRFLCVSSSSEKQGKKYTTDIKVTVMGYIPDFNGSAYRHWKF